MAQQLRFKNILTRRIQVPRRPPTAVTLNALDHFEALFVNEIIYVYSETIDAGRLEASLRRVLELFPDLCGQAVRGPGGTLGLQWQQEGAQFSVRDCSASFSEVCTGLNASCRALDFIDRVNPFTLTRANNPLARFMLTRLDGGGSVLGISISHGLADGVSYYQFIRIWSQIHEGLPWTPPAFGRDLLACEAGRQLELFGCRGRLPASCCGFRCWPRLGFAGVVGKMLLRQHAMVTRAIPFTRPQLNAIRDAVAGSRRLSLNDALCAHLWQTLARTGGQIRPGRQYKMLTIASLRGRGALGVPREYFGNAVAHMITQLPGEEILDAGIDHLAALCRTALDGLDDRDVLRQMVWLRHQEERGRLRRVSADVDLFAGDCIISSMYRLPVDDAVFDGQRPSRKAYTVVPAPWVLWLKPWAQQPGGIEIYAHLPRAFADRLSSEPLMEALYRFGEADDEKQQSDPPAGQTGCI